RHYEECRSTPSFGGSATGQSAAILPAYDEAALQHRRHYRHALRRAQHFLRDSFVRRALNLIQNLGRGLGPIRGLRFFRLIIDLKTSALKISGLKIIALKIHRLSSSR